MGQARAPEETTRVATAADAGDIARMLFDFNTEYSDPTPEPEVLAERLGPLLASDEVTVVLGGAGPDGLALLRFKPSLWSDGLEAYLEELYVVPRLRGQGIGRAMMERAMDLARERGATRMDLGTSTDDTAARALYEKLGFTNLESQPDGPPMLFYERDL
jgi:ribosomal protein S18 acetylase RimI-like enzyme